MSQSLRRLPMSMTKKENKWIRSEMTKALTIAFDFLKSNAIVRAFVISLLIHLFSFFVIDIGNRLKLWDIKFVAQKKPTNQTTLPTDQKEQQVVLQFIDVQDTQAPEPKDPKFYSAANSQAANPDTSVETNTPKNDGQQEKVPQIRDVAKA